MTASSTEQPPAPAPDESRATPQGVRFQTLGCKVNQVESGAIAQAAKQAGVPVATDGTHAPVVVINTCAVTAEAEAKTRKAIRRACRDTSVQRVIVTGCAAGISAEQLSEIHDKVRVVPSKADVPGAILDVLPSSGLSDSLTDQNRVVHSGRTRVMVKVNDGCENFCSYCIVPYARGPQRSEPAAEIAELVQRLSDQGVPEVVLTGINIGRYQDPVLGGGLPGLVALLGRTGLHRLRISSIEPNDVTEELLAALSARSFGCEHLHIPLQSGSDRVLEDMNRHYSTEYFAGVVALVRKHWPDAAITTDVIVGYPTEAEEDFRNTLELCEELRFSRLHVFRYSPRPGTPAAELPLHDPEVVARRSEELRLLGERLATEYAESFIGREVETVVQHVERGTATLMSRHFLTYPIDAGTLKAGDVVNHFVSGA